MKNRNLVFGAIVILVMVSFSVYFYLNKSPFNKDKSFWKAGDNPIFGDVFHITNKEANFKNDTIFVNQKPIAVVLNIQNRFWSGDRVLTLKNIETGEIGTYYEK